MKNPDIFICEVIETKMNENINKINKNDSIFKADTLHNELRILDRILYQCVIIIEIIHLVVRITSIKYEYNTLMFAYLEFIV